MTKQRDRAVAVGVFTPHLRPGQLHGAVPDPTDDEAVSDRDRPARRSHVAGQCGHVWQLLSMRDVFSENLSRDLIAVEGSRRTGVRLEMNEQLDDLVLGNAIVEGYA